MYTYQADVHLVHEGARVLVELGVVEDLLGLRKTCLGRCMCDWLMLCVTCVVCLHVFCLMCALLFYS